MSYEKRVDKLAKLESLIAETLKKREIKSGASLAKLHEEALTSELKEKSPEIWEAAAGEIEDFNQLEAQQEEFQEVLRLEKEKLSSGRRKLVLKTPRWAVVAIFIALLIVLFLIAEWAMNLTISSYLWSVYQSVSTDVMEFGQPDPEDQSRSYVAFGALSLYVAWCVAVYLPYSNYKGRLE